jgi:hypothetical protein
MKQSRGVRWKLLPIIYLVLIALNAGAQNLQTEKNGRKSELSQKPRLDQSKTRRKARLEVSRKDRPSSVDLCGSRGSRMQQEIEARFLEKLKRYGQNSALARPSSTVTATLTTAVDGNRYDPIELIQ